jgi:hypothetical protein
MARLLGTVVIVVLVVALIGYYRGWFTVDTSNSSDQSNIHMTIDKDAVHHDERELEQKLSPTTNQSPN